jgi:hypothetical protein
LSGGKQRTFAGRKIRPLDRLKTDAPLSFNESDMQWHPGVKKLRTFDRGADQARDFRGELLGVALEPVRSFGDEQIPDTANLGSRDGKLSIRTIILGGSWLRSEGYSRRQQDTGGDDDKGRTEAHAEATQVGVVHQTGRP